MSLERQAAVHGEVQKLLEVNFIREIQFMQWLSNVVLVPKPGGNWRICIDFTNLNKACPKDDQPLPRIDQMVNATAGHELLSFMDAYSGYNHIHMQSSDEHKTSFITDSGVDCYTRMPFGLKNAGATFQRLINTVFQTQIGRNTEAYVDDILTKSVLARNHPKDLKETFESLRRYAVKLNLAKCVFGVQDGKFLGFLISQRGIEVNPENIEAIQKMQTPSSFKDVMILNGRLTALSRFIAQAAEQSLPFFKILRRRWNYQWTEEAASAFQELKMYLMTPPLLTRPKKGEILYLYLGVTQEVVSAVLIREEEGFQTPVYYMSKVLKDAELRYPSIEKVAFAVMVAARKLLPYFHAHMINVLTNEPLQKVLGAL